MRVGIDLDGVCYDFRASVARYLNSIGYDHPAMAQEPRQWYFHAEWGLTEQEFLEALHDGVSAGVIFTGPDRDDAALHIQLLKSAGHSIHIVTDRRSGPPGRAMLNTVRWLHAHQIPYDSLTFSGDKTVVKTDVFIEDKVENYDALVSAGTRAYLVNRDYNQEIDNRVRVASIGEFANLVLSRGMRAA